MVRRYAHDRPVFKGGARSGGLLLALLGVLITQASQAQEAAPAASGGADAGAVDTSITVQSSRATKPLHTIDSARMKSGIGAQMPRQQAFPSSRDRPMPNAVGFPVARSGLPQAALPATPPPGIDTFLDMGRSATNVIGNSLATAVVAKWEGELAPEHALGPDDVVPPDMIPGEVPGMQAGHV